MKEAIRFFNLKCVLSKSLMACLGMAFMIALLAGQAQAFMVKTTNSDLKVRFDNTFTYSTMFRVADQDPILIGDEPTPFTDINGATLTNLNADDGDRNFDKGIVMNRMDWIPELDVSYNKFGVRFSAIATYDTVYNTENDNDSPLTNNSSSVEYNEFPEITQELMGKNIELGDAFTFGSIKLGKSQLNYKVGQFAMFWGQGFFPWGNGVADIVSPISAMKAASLPNVQMKELIRQIPQVSLNLLATDRLSFGGYYQFKWKGTLIPPAGSYFSNADLLLDGGEQLLGGADNQSIPIMARTKDAKPSDSGQYGLQVKYQAAFGVDFGAYYVNYHDKGPQVVARLGEFEVAPGVVLSPFPTNYTLAYAENIKNYTVSANTSYKIWTIAAEVSYRTNVPIRSASGALATFVDQEIALDGDDVLWPVGKSLHANINFFVPGLPANFFSDTADFIMEWMWNKRLSVDTHEDIVDPDMKESAIRGKIVYTPKWYQALPAFDLILPLGIEYAPEARSSVVKPFGIHKGGNWNIGIGGTYNYLWDLQLTYVNYFGDTKYSTLTDNYSDRDYVGFYIRRAF